MEDPAIKKAITVLDTLSSDPETVRLAELRMKNILDEKSMIEGAKEEGKREGQKEGIVQGKQGALERNMEIAKNALIKGAEVSFVSAITGLSEEEVRKIKSEIKKNNK